MEANDHWRHQNELINNQNTKIFKLEDKESIDDVMFKQTGFKFIHFKARHHMHNVFDSDHFLEIRVMKFSRIFLIVVFSQVIKFFLMSK